MKRVFHIFFIMFFALVPYYVFAEDVCIDRPVEKTIPGYKEKIEKVLGKYFYFTFNKQYDFSETNQWYIGKKQNRIKNIEPDNFVKYILWERSFFLKNSPLWLFSNAEKTRESIIRGLKSGRVSGLPPTVYYAFLYSDQPYDKMYLTDYLCKDFSLGNRVLSISPIFEISEKKSMFSIENIGMNGQKGQYKLFFIIAKIENSIFKKINSRYEVIKIYATSKPEKDDSVEIVLEMEKKVSNYNNEIRKVIYGMQDSFFEAE
jgi:hypothetical protein